MADHRVAVAAWGNAGYRAFVPSGSGVAYCRTVKAEERHRVLVYADEKLEWGATRTSKRVPLGYPTPSEPVVVSPAGRGGFVR